VITVTIDNSKEWDIWVNNLQVKIKYLNVGDDANLNCKDELLVDLGIEVKPLGLNRNILKRAPHDKYLIWET